MKIELFFPVKPNSINQIFGNKDDKYKQLGLIGHNGIDFWAVHGEPVFASHDGTLYNDPVDIYGGHGVTVVSQLQADGAFKTIYWHFIPEIVRQNGPVKVGDLIGYADNTGFTTGDHLHFGLKKIDALGNTLNKDNGYFGAIDPAPYFNGFYAEDSQKVISLYQKLVELLQKLKEKYA